MPGNRIGGLKAAKTNKKKYGKNFYKQNGQKGGKAGGLKGFALNRELAKKAGAKGGAMSRRTGRITTASNVVKILRLHDKGLSATEIGKKLGLGADGVRYHIRKAEDFNKLVEKANG